MTWQWSTRRSTGAECYDGFLGICFVFRGLSLRVFWSVRVGLVWGFLFLCSVLLLRMNEKVIEFMTRDEDPTPFPNEVMSRPSVIKGWPGRRGSPLSMMSGKSNGETGYMSSPWGGGGGVRIYVYMPYALPVPQWERPCVWNKFRTKSSKEKACQRAAVSSDFMWKISGITNQNVWPLCSVHIFPSRSPAD